MDVNFFYPGLKGHARYYLMKYEYVASVKLGSEDGALSIETVRPDEFYSRLPGIVLENGVEVQELHSPDDNLQAVFQYLVG